MYDNKRKKCFIKLINDKNNLFLGVPHHPPPIFSAHKKIKKNKVEEEKTELWDIGRDRTRKVEIY